MSYSRGRIQGHSLDFLNKEISGWEWDEMAGPDWDGDGLPDGYYFYEIFTSEDEDSSGWNDYQNLSEWGGISENNGVYSAEQTIRKDENFLVDYVSFAIIDQDAFDENGAE